MERLFLKDMTFVNESGRLVILHGENVLCRERAMGHIYPEIEKVFPYFRRMGCNLASLRHLLGCCGAPARQDRLRMPGQS